MRIALLALALSAVSAVAAEPLTLEQTMADPDWIGPPVEGAFWSLDGKSVNYQLKRVDSVLRDTYSIELAGGAPRKLDDAQLAKLDAAAPQFDRERRRALFVRNGD